MASHLNLLRLMVILILTKYPPLIIVDGVETDYTMEELEEKHPT
jgi:hypothetical protein